MPWAIGLPQLFIILLSIPQFIGLHSYYSLLVYPTIRRLYRFAILATSSPTVFLSSSSIIHRVFIHATVYHYTIHGPRGVRPYLDPVHCFANHYPWSAGCASTPQSTVAPSMVSEMCIHTAIYWSASILQSTDLPAIPRPRLAIHTMVLVYIHTTVY
jgi:hypothetical protein